MAEPGHWPRLYREVAAEYKEVFERAKRQLIDEELPGLLERVGPQQRLMLYGTIDFDALMNADPCLYQKLSADALALEEKRRADEAARLDEYEKEIYDRRKLLLAQVDPLGATVEEAIGEWPVNLR